MYRRTALFIIAATLIVLLNPVTDSDPIDMRSLAGNFYFRIAEFDPVWGTNAGIHAHDSLFPEISDRWKKEHFDFIQRGLDLLNGFDTTEWSFDNQIDYALLKSDIKYRASEVRENYFNSKAVMTYPEKCYDGLFYLMARQNLPLEERFPAIISRMKKIPDFLERSQGYIDSSSHKSTYFAGGEIYKAQTLIKCYSEVLIDSFPDKNAYISTIRDKAIFSLENYIEKSRELYRNQIKEFAIGKDAFNFVLSEVYFLDFDVDSVKNIAETIYKEAALLENKYTPDPDDDLSGGRHSCIVTGPSEDSSLQYCYGEIDSITNYLHRNNIVTVPPELSACIFVHPEKSGLIEHSMEDCYVGPGQLDPDRTGYYYTNFGMLLRSFGSELPRYYAEQRSRGDFIKNIIPGNHLQFFIAGNHPSLIRRIQRNEMMRNGWVMYFEELLALEGLIGENPAILSEIYKEIKMSAIGTIIDIGIHCERLSYDSLNVIFNSLTGIEGGWYNSEYKGYPHTTRNLSYTLGRFLILEMKENAKAKEGNKFNLKDFHDKILSEGCIPPALIAKKYGW
jgi:hypothetical protein